MDGIEVHGKGHANGDKVPIPVGGLTGLQTAFAPANTTRQYPDQARRITRHQVKGMRDERTIRCDDDGRRASGPRCSNEHEPETDADPYVRAVSGTGEARFDETSQRACSIETPSVRAEKSVKDQQAVWGSAAPELDASEENTPLGQEGSKDTRSG